MAQLQEVAGPTKLVCFELQGQEFGADIGFVKESLTHRPIAKVPLTPAWLAGIINLRGDVVAILDLGLFFGMQPASMGPASRIIIARHEQRRLGFLCDRLCNLRIEDLARLQPPPPTLQEDAANVMAGLLTLDDGHALRVLDLAALFASHQLAAFRRGERS